LNKVLVIFVIAIQPFNAKADFWGGDLPLLTEIVFNTLHTMMELEQQTNYWSEQMEGIHDRIDRVQTIANIVEPSNWNKWKDPQEAISRLRMIYQTMPKEYRSEKSDEIETELANAMNLAARLKPETESSFKSGKELERRGADASPGVAQKLTASGVGSLVSIQSQSLAVQSHITSLLAQMMADANEKETRAVTTRGSSFKFFASNLRQTNFSFSQLVLGRKAEQ
jgi:hypothetical protein